MSVREVQVQFDEVLGQRMRCACSLQTDGTWPKKCIFRVLLSTCLVFGAIFTKTVVPYPSFHHPSFHPTQPHRALCSALNSPAARVRLEPWLCVFTELYD